MAFNSKRALVGGAVGGIPGAVVGGMTGDKPFRGTSREALIGGLIAGPLGWAAGGFMGGDRKQQELAEKQAEEARVNARLAVPISAAVVRNRYGMPDIEAGPQAQAVAGDTALNTPASLPGMPAYNYRAIRVPPQLKGLARQQYIRAQGMLQQAKAGLQRQLQMRNFMDSEYLRRIQEAKQQFSDFGNAQREALARSTQQNMAAANQRAQQQGWGSSSVAANYGRGVRADANFNRAQLEQNILDRQMQTGQNLTGQRLAFLNSITDEAPSNAEAQDQLMGAYGAKLSDERFQQQMDMMRDAQKKAFWGQVLGGAAQGLGAAAGNRIPLPA